MAVPTKAWVTAAATFSASAAPTVVLPTTTTGQFLLIGVFLHDTVGTGTPSSVSISAGSIDTMVTIVASPAAANRQFHWLQVWVTGGGATPTLTVNLSGSRDGRLIVHGLSGVDPTTPVPAASVGSKDDGANVTTHDATSAAVTYASDSYWFAGFEFGNTTGVITPSGSWVSDTTSATFVSISESAAGGLSSELGTITSGTARRALNAICAVSGIVAASVFPETFPSADRQLQPPGRALAF